MLSTTYLRLFEVSLIIEDEVSAEQSILLFEALPELFQGSLIVSGRFLTGEHASVIEGNDRCWKVSYGRYQIGQERRVSVFSEANSRYADCCIVI